MVVDGGDVDGSGVAADDDVGRLLELKWKVECPARSLHPDADEFLLTYGEGQRGFARWWCSTPRRGRGKENIHPILDRLTAAGFSLVVESCLAKEAVSNAIVARKNDIILRNAHRRSA